MNIISQCSAEVAHCKNINILISSVKGRWNINNTILSRGRWIKTSRWDVKSENSFKKYF